MFVHAIRAVGATVLVVTGGVGVFLGWQAWPTLTHYGLSFFTETTWQPEADILGIRAVLTGTVMVALVAMWIAFPLALLTALYISEYAPAFLRPALVSQVDLMAAVPSIIWGLWGYFLIMPHAARRQPSCAAILPVTRCPRRSRGVVPPHQRRGHRVTSATRMLRPHLGGIPTGANASPGRRESRAAQPP